MPRFFTHFVRNNNIRVCEWVWNAHFFNYLLHPPFLTLSETYLTALSLCLPIKKTTTKFHKKNKAKKLHYMSVGESAWSWLKPERENMLSFSCTHTHTTLSTNLWLAHSPLQGILNDLRNCYKVSQFCKPWEGEWEHKESCVCVLCPVCAFGWLGDHTLLL